MGIKAGKSTAATSTGSYSGGNVYIDVGASTNGASSDEGAIYLRQSDGSTAIVTASATTFTATSGTVAVTATSAATLTAGTTMTLSAATAIDFSDSYVKGFTTGTASVTSTSSGVTISKQAGSITSATAALVAGATDIFTLTNTYVSSTSLVFVTVKESCTSGYVVVTDATPGSGTVSVTVFNAGASACTSTYKLHFLVINNS